jgi:hypothetical protein
MFGIRCGDLTLENLVFSGIHAEGLATLFALSADSLTIRNVLVEDCGVRETNAILAENAGRADLENVFIARCDAELETSGGGLLDWVSENASFRRIGLANVSVFLYPDGGGSGYTAGSAGLLVSKIGGSASFEEIESYRCTMYTLNSAALCFEPGSLAVCSDILVDSGSFLGFPNGKSMMGFPVNNLLFGWNETADNAQNVILRDSVFNPYKPLEDYTAFTIENCIAVTDREQ